MKQEEFDRLKWLWKSTSDSPILRKVADAICNRGNIEALQWLWKSTSDGIILRKVADAICNRGNIEALQWLWKSTSDGAILRKVANAITDLTENHGDTLDNANKGKRTLKEYEYDCFVCHASEDKKTCVSELVKKLRRRGYKVWYDEFTLTLGDSLRRKIDNGLANSRFGIVILSKYFFEKEWPQKELDGLVAREREGKKVILPIWHGLTKHDVLRYSPILAGRLAASTNKGLDYVIREIVKAIKPLPP